MEISADKTVFRGRSRFLVKSFSRRTTGRNGSFAITVFT